MHPYQMSELARLHAEELRRQADAERLARSVQRVERPQLRDRLNVAALAAGTSVVAALVVLAVR